MTASGTRILLYRTVTSCSCCRFIQTSSQANTNADAAVYKIAPQALHFDDHRVVFQHKNTWELLRALFVLRACGSDFLVDNSLKLLRQGQRILGNKVLGWFLHPTVYSQFVAGQESSELAVVTESLRKLGIKLMVAPTLEEDLGESSTSQDKYDKNLKEMFRLAELTHRHGGVRSCLQTKITAMVSADTLNNLSHVYVNETVDKWTVMVDKIASAMVKGSEMPRISGISSRDHENLTLAIRRLKFLGEAAESKNLHLLVDAEYSYLNPGCNLMTLAMMAVFNQQHPIIANTYQCYFKRSLQTFTLELEVIKRLGVCFSAKLVRGAYLERERQLDPESTWPSHAKTGENYHRVLEEALIHAQEAGPKRCLIIIATHNEDTVRHAVSRLLELGLDSTAGHVVFAQIYGMAEQISMPLAKAGYLVYKSVPMGSLNEVLPYLARRAAENRSVLKGARKERELLQKELYWRLRARFRS